MTKKVLVSEKLADAGIQVLQGKGYQVDVKLDMTRDQLISAIPAYDALIVRSATKVTADVIGAGSNLTVIGRAGVGVDNIDIDAATEHGIVVCNAPTSNIVSAAEQTMALLLASARKIAAANASMKAHQWQRSDYVGTELYEKTLAICGLGRIGGLVAERAKAFGMKLIGFDPYGSPERAEALGVTLYSRLEDVLSLADFITVHLPKTKETIGMFGAAQFACMKDGVIVVNAARGGIYDIDALADAMRSGKVAACGIDVWEHEPCTDSALHDIDMATLTPHLGASTVEAQRRAGVQIAEYVAAGLEGEIVPTAVNMTPVPPEVMSAVGPYVPACTLMGSTLAQMADGIPSQLKITEAGSIASADPSILVSGALDGIMSAAKGMRVSPVNADAVARRFGIRVQTNGTADAGEYASTVAVRCDDLEMACTIAAGGQAPRIVNLLGYKIDMIPQTHALVFEYIDAPGRIGTIGTILGKAGINITTMQIGTKPKEQHALVFVNVEQEVPPAVLRALHDGLDLKNLWYIQL